MAGTTQTQPVSANPVSTLESRPVPDPTVRTVEQLHREIEWAEKLRDKEFEHLQTFFAEATAARDRAIALLQAFTDKSPTTAEVSGAVDALKELMAEKFKSVDKQFTERDARTEQTSKDSKVAVDAALQAAKEAVSEQNKSNALAMAKSEASFTKQIDQQRDTSQQTASNIDGKINDLKDRLTAIEGRSKGAGDQWAVIIAVVMAVIAFGSLAFTAFVALKK